MRDPFDFARDWGVKLSTKNPRVQGAVIFAACIVLNLINVAMILGEGRYIVMMVLAGVGFMPLSIWVMITGRAGTRNEPKAPLWWWAGTVIILAITAIGALAFVSQ